MRFLLWKRTARRKPVDSVQAGAHRPDAVVPEVSAGIEEVTPADPDGARIARIVQESGLFDPVYYLRRHADVAGVGGTPLVHFCEYGMREHRDPGPDFDTHKYLEKVPAARASVLPPFLYFLESEDRDEPSFWLSQAEDSFRYLVERSGLFDSAWYLRRYEDLARSGMDPLDHLVKHGAKEWRDPGPGFDSDFYAERYPAFVGSRLSPLEHYLRIGQAAGFAATGGTKYQRWIARFDALSEADRAAIREDAARTPLPPITLVRVAPGARADAPDDEPSIVASQIGIGPDVPFACLTATARSDPASILKDCPNGTVLILVGGAVRLRPHAAYVFASALARLDAEAAYADHDRLVGEARIRPVFKPAMSPDFMRRLDYAGPVIAVRLSGRTRPLVEEALRRAVEGDAGRAWSGLLLAFEPHRVAHIPFLLYATLGEAVAEDTANPIYEPVPSAAEHPVRPGGEPETAPRSFSAPPQQPAEVSVDVHIIIPTRDRHALLRECIESLAAKTDYPRDRLRIVVVDNDSREPESLAYLEELSRRANCAVVRSPGPFNFSQICNAGAAAADGAVLVFLNNDTTVLREGWLRDLVREAIRPEIGVVGAQLLYPDDTVQHGGVVLGLRGVGGHRLVGVRASDAARRDVTREMVAVTGACFAIRRSVFEEIGGFDPVLGTAFNDTKLCADAYAAGYRNLYLAEPLLYHHESKSRGFDDTPAKRALNRREAIYVRERYGDLFRNDPTYSPNLSLHHVGMLGLPPRVVRPWRRSRPEQRRALLLSSVHGLGHGVAEVLAAQAAFLVNRGWLVTVGGPETRRDRTYPSCRRVGIWTPDEAAALAVSEGMDCVVAHTPPFFSVARYVGRRPLVYLFDHGEPPTSLFSDVEAREDIDWEKRFCAPLARRVFAISQAIDEQQYRRDAVVVRNGNSHLATWSAEWAERRQALRRTYGFEGRYVVLNVCRFGKEERRYKGVDAYIELAHEAPFRPGPGRKTLFVLAGRGDAADVAYVRDAGLTVFPNVSDEELAELYAAADLYVSLSQWEGYNLGIGQALAMGLDAVASDIPAHREFGIGTANGAARLCALIADRFRSWDEGAEARAARVEAWEHPLSAFADILEADCAEEDAAGWF